MGYFPSPLWAFFAVFLHVLGGGDDKIEVIQEILCNVPWAFYYRHILSYSEFVKCY